MRHGGGAEAARRRLLCWWARSTAANGLIERGGPINDGRCQPKMNGLVVRLVYLCLISLLTLISSLFGSGFGFGVFECMSSEFRFWRMMIMTLMIAYYSLSPIFCLYLWSCMCVGLCFSSSDNVPLVLLVVFGLVFGECVR